MVLGPLSALPISEQREGFLKQADCRLERVQVTPEFQEK
jgi:hypothetical protein